MKKTKETRKNQKGITLIALVITIIVLLILAAISIATLTGNNGILTQAKNAKEKNIIGREKEEIGVAVNACKTQKYNNLDSDITAKELEDELNLNEEKANVIGSGTLTVKFNETGNMYKVSQNGTISETKYTEEGKTQILEVLSGDYALNANGMVVPYTAEEGTEYLKATIGEEIKEINGFKQFNFNYILDEDGNVFSMGETDENGNKIAEKVEELANIKYITAKWNGKYAINTKGEVYAWGNNNYGQLGIGTTEDMENPTKIEGLTNVKNLIMDDGSVLAVTENGEVYSWGNNNYGQLGNNTTNNTSKPEKVNGLSNIEQVYLNSHSAFALTENGEIYSWGNNYSAGLGLGQTNNKILVPTKIEQLSNIEKFYPGGANFAKTTDGQLYSWGDNSYGNTGLGTKSEVLSPQKITGIPSVVEMYGNGYSVFAKTTDGQLYAWGDNKSGDLGLGEEIKDTTRPNKVNIPSKVKYVSEHGYDSTKVAVTVENEVYIWGSNDKNQITSNSESSIIKNPINLKENHNIEKEFIDFKILDGTLHQLYFVTSDNELYVLAYGGAPV